MLDERAARLGEKKYSPPRLTTNSCGIVSGVVSSPGNEPMSTWSSLVGSRAKAAGSTFFWPMIGSNPDTCPAGFEVGFGGKLAVSAQPTNAVSGRKWKTMRGRTVLDELEAARKVALVADKGQTADGICLVILLFLICDFRTVGYTGTHNSEFVKDAKVGGGRIIERS